MRGRVKDLEKIVCTALVDAVEIGREKRFDLGAIRNVVDFWFAERCSGWGHDASS
jgi:hypothetical protein